MVFKGWYFKSKTNMLWFDFRSFPAPVNICPPLILFLSLILSIRHSFHFLSPPFFTYPIFLTYIFGLNSARAPIKSEKSVIWGSRTDPMAQIVSKAKLNGFIAFEVISCTTHHYLLQFFFIFRTLYVVASDGSGTRNLGFGFWEGYG